MLKSNTKRIKGYLTNINYLILFFAINSCQDNYQNCLDLEYGTEYIKITGVSESCLLYTSPSPRDRTRSRMPSSA